ncbi:MAG TPA: hypothetical protein PKG52_04430 [bacterium]|nr:hypothetical protein [bacterium]
MILSRIYKFITVLFVFSIPLTFLYWTFFSDRSGVDDETEKEFARILNEEFEEGDAVFPEIDWDLGFLQYLNPGITSIFLTLKEATNKELRYMKDEGGRIFFLLKNEEKWDEISSRMEVSEIKRIKAGRGFVIIGSDGTEKFRKDFSFVRDIGKAKEVWFSKKDTKFPCVISGVNRWQCSKDEWNYVGMTSATLNGKTQRVVWAHPKSDMTLHMLFDIPEQASKLILNTAFLETAYRSDNTAPVEVDVLFDGASVLKYSNKSESRIYTNSIQIPNSAKQVEINFSTENDGQRHFVFNGYMTK